MATILEAISLAVQQHQAGRLAEAEQIYRQVLAVDPNHPVAWHLLGVIALQAGRWEVAVEFIARAIKLNQKVAEFHNNLGEAYRVGWKVDAAIDSYQRAIQLKPEFVEPHHNLAEAFRTTHQYDAAIAEYRRALYYRPEFVEALNHLGIVWKNQGQLAEAAACVQRALTLRPDFAEAHNTLGTIHIGLGDSAAALASFQRAVELNPNYAEAHNNLGNVWKRLGRLDESVACYRRAVQLQPDSPESWFSLANGLAEQKLLADAVTCHERALQLQPDFTAALSALVATKQSICQWDDLYPLAQRLCEAVENSTDVGRGVPISPFTFLLLPIETTPRQQLRCARQWATRKLNAFIEQGERQPLAPRPVEIGAGLPRSKSRLTIGYLSADFRSHPMSYTIVEVLEKHDRARFSVCGYSYGPDDGSPIRRRISQACDRFVDLTPTTFAQAAECIAADGVDILIDLTGYTTHARTEIVALRPAPIQVNYWGFPGTMGVAFVDYGLIDEFVVPREHDTHFTEKLVRLPGCYVPSDSQCAISADTPSRQACGLPDEGFVFCCFNNSFKFTPAVFEIWMKLLEAVPGSVLWLLEGNRFIPANLRKEAERRGVDGNRLVFSPWLPVPDYLARYRLADLFLDTFPYNAHTTARDALWVGCPVLTRTGTTFVSRVAGSLLKAVGLPELITTCEEEYYELALQLAGDRGRLAELQARLNANRRTSPLFDGAAMARKFELAFDVMWEMHLSGQSPRAIDLVGTIVRP